LEDSNAKEKTMIKGFNQPLPLWISLLNDKVKSEALASYLRSIPATQKALRWPAGTGGKTYIFDKDLTNKFNVFCVQSGIESLSLVVNPNDINGFLETYKILSANMEIVVLEFDNENYLRSHIQKQIKNASDLKLFSLNFNKFSEKIAIEYRTKFVQFKKTLASNGINEPLAFVSDIPNDAKSSIWFNALKNYSDNCVIHVYGQPDNPNYHKGLANSLEKLKDKNIFVTEYNPIYFGDSTETIKNENLEFSDTYFEYNKKSLAVLNRLNVKGIWKHMLFDILEPNRILTPYRQLTIFPNGLIKDEYGSR
jgi:hypothetical protein